MIERNIIPLLDEMPITSLLEFNDILKAKITRLNEKPFSKRNGCRKSIFDEDEKKRLKPLPARPFHSSIEKKATVSRDYHIQYDNAFYSVPVDYIGQRVTVKDDSFEINIYNEKGYMIAKHDKAIHKWQRCTDEKHIPVGHASDNAYTLEYFLLWSHKFGPNMADLCKRISERFTYPVQSFRTLNSILVSASKCSSPALAEEAARKCLGSGTCSTKGFNSMLKATIETCKQAKKAQPFLDGLFCSHGSEEVKQ